jgi:hypothetical protein
MDGRYWVWLGVRLLVGAVIVGWAASYLMPGSGEKEFQRTLDALKQVHSVRIATTTDQLTQHSEMLWEVSCPQQAYHYTRHLVDATNPGTPSEINQDEMHVGTLQYDHQSDDSWAPSKHWNTGSTAINLCARISQGGDNGPMPAIATMIQRGILQKGDKKTVGGVRCREWNVTLKGPTGLEHDTVCLGVDDHLPYESTVDWQHSRTLYSDYNSPVQLALPDAGVRSTSATTATN